MDIMKVPNKRRKVKKRPIEKNYRCKLPKTVIDAVNILNLTENKKEKSFEFIYNLISISIKENGFSDNYVQVYSKDLSSGYKSWLDVLLESGVVKTDNHYENRGENTKCKQYRVNREVIDGTYKLNTTTIKYKETPKLKQSLLQQGFEKSVKSIEFPKEKLESELKSMADSIDKNSVVLNEDIPNGNYKIIYNRTQLKEYYSSKEKALEKARELNKDLILHENKLYLKKLDSFINERRLDSEMSNHNALFRLIDGCYKCGRNETNYRFDTPFSNLSKKLFGVIKEHNGLVEIDAKNSQYALLANLIGEEDSLFYDDATKGVLYDKIKDKFNISRDESKSLMMLIVFGKLDNNTPHKEAFKKMYSNANNFIEEYKKKNPENIQSRTIKSQKDYYKALPIRLQRMESDFWIDGVLTECYKRNINAISRHDSITVHKQDKQEVIDIIEVLAKEKSLIFKLDTYVK